MKFEAHVALVGDVHFSSYIGIRTSDADDPGILMSVEMCPILCNWKSTQLRLATVLRGLQDKSEEHTTKETHNPRGAEQHNRTCQSNS